MYLAVTGEEVVLQGKELRNVCRFEAWQRQVSYRQNEKLVCKYIRHRWGGTLTCCCGCRPPPTLPVR